MSKAGRLALSSDKDTASSARRLFGAAGLVAGAASQAKLAFAVYESVVREVYRINGWFPAGSTFNYRNDGRAKGHSERWEFVGVIAEDRIRKRYLNRHAGEFFSAGAQNPISYVNIP